MQEKILFEPIGFIETCFKERFGTPRQPQLAPSSWGVVSLRPELNLDEALDGLAGFSHVWLIFLFHQNANKGVNAKVHPPRMEGEKIGLFATRTPHRPNPIGLSVAKIESVEKGRLHLSGVDLIDGTPILDIKPYVPSADCLPNAHAGWTGSKPERTLQVIITEQAASDIQKHFRERAERAHSTIRELLELDPRPVFYRGTKENPNPYTDVYGFRFDDFNVVYRMQEAIATVLSIEPWAEYLAKKSTPPE